MAIRMTGMVSGLDTDSIVKELVSAYSTKKEKYEKEQTKLGWKQEIWKSLNKEVNSFYKSAGKDLNTALKQISMWNLDKNSPPTKESELTNTIKSIYYSKASYGCTTIKELIDCNCSDCNLKNRRN